MNNWTSKDHNTPDLKVLIEQKPQRVVSRGPQLEAIFKNKCCTDVNAPFRIQSLLLKLGKGPILDIFIVLRGLKLRRVRSQDPRTCSTNYNLSIWACRESDQNFSYQKYFKSTLML